MIDVYEWKNQKILLEPSPMDFIKNGNITLQPKSCVLTAEINGDISIELDHCYDSVGRYKYLKADNIIAAPAPPPWSSRQLFRINGIKYCNNYVKIYARHIMFDLRNYIIPDMIISNRGAQIALDNILGSTPFNAYSDNAVGSASAKYIRKTVLEALKGDIDNSYIKRWDSEIYPDNYNIYAKTQIGSDNNIIVSIKNNLVGFEGNISTDNIATAIMPVGFDGLTLPYQNTNPYVIGEKYAQQPIPKIAIVEYPDIKVKSSENDEDGYDTKEEAYAALRTAAEADLKDPKFFEPDSNFKISIAKLPGEFQKLKDVGLGDIIRAKHTAIATLGISQLHMRCTKLTYNCITKQNITLEIDNTHNKITKNIYLNI